jgi:hypothetical protein
MTGRRLLKYRIDRTSSYLTSITNNNVRRFFESQTEVSHGLMMEFNDDIELYNTQPFTLEYEKENGKIGNYTLDVIYKGVDGFWAKEVKNGFYCNKDKVKAEYECIKHYLLKHHKLRFDVVFSDEFSPKNTFHNQALLYKYRQLSKLQLGNFKLKKHMGNTFKLGELRDFTRQKHLPEITAFGLVAYKFATFDFEQKLTNETILEAA